MGYQNNYNHLLKAKIRNKFKQNKVFAKTLGITEQTVCNWIAYRNPPSYRHARKVEWILRTTIKELFPKEKYGKITAN